MQTEREGMKLRVCVVAVLSLIGCAMSTGRGVQAAQKKPVAVALSGREIFELRCAGCHSLDKDGKGPRLRGVYGRRAGAIQWPEYSSGMRLASFAWTDEKLDAWLKDPDSVVDVSNMDFRLSKKVERKAVIDFLKSPAAN